MLILQDRLTRLTLAPEIGGSLAGWQALDSGWPLLRPATADDLASGSPRRLACYPLVPWSNRIDRGGFANPDGWLALAPNSPGEPLPIHGSAWQQPWRVLEQGAQHAHLALDSASPFPYRAEQRIDLDEGRLDLVLEVQHLGSAPAWYGLGLHPYLPRTPATRLQAQASGVWHEPGHRLPERCIVLPAEWDFREPRALPEETLDHAFDGWDGCCRILQADAGYALECRAEGAGLFLLYTPQGRDFFCFEPVSHPVNAHHLPGRPGLRLLASRQRLRLGWSMHYRAVGPGGR
ncbi:aldose 1-epimerase [Azotobacter armeniacus]